MFGFLKDKLKNVVDSFKKDVEEEVEVVEEIKKEPVKVDKKPKASENKKEAKSDKKETKETKKEKPKKTVEKKPTEVKTEQKKTEPSEPEVFKESKDSESEDETIEEQNITEEAQEEPKEEKKGFFSKIFSKKEETIEETSKTETAEKETEDIPQAPIEEKKGFFQNITEKVTKFNLSEEKFNDLFWDLEITLLENNVAVEVIEKIKNDLKEELCTGKVSRKGVEEVIKDTLRQSIDEVLSIESFDLLSEVKTKKPYVIAFIGVNGSGKTTHMAKIANYLKNNGLSIVFAAADTFRAAAIQQLEEHANKLGIRTIKHDYNADPAAVAFDAIEHAKSKGIDVVMIDTAGRLHSNTNLMQELKKLIRVNEPDMKIFVGESITGNDCVEQATVYNDEVGIDGIILSKADVDEKGGAAISVSYVTKKPILFIGTGQTYDDIEKFDKEKILESIGL